ncbi:MAG TPA: hypothetical protein VFV38_15905 [Ktedonobacteraceae bacterium]|nr:hypothetical protein [Ktedonobacteraceae bacterium]
MEHSHYSACARVQSGPAAGDVADPYYRQAITAAADGSHAAIDVRRWLEHQQTRPYSTPQQVPFSLACCQSQRCS